MLIEPQLKVLGAADDITSAIFFANRPFKTTTLKGDQSGKSNDTGITSGSSNARNESSLVAFSDTTFDSYGEDLDRIHFVFKFSKINISR